MPNEESKRRVLAVYPNAKALVLRERGRWQVVRKQTGFDFVALSGKCATEQDAWESAANSLPSVSGAEPENCPSCGYTKADAQFNMDHHLCKNASNAPWEQPASQPAPTVGYAVGAQEYVAFDAVGSMMGFGNTPEEAIADMSSQPAPVPAAPSEDECEHENFRANVAVGRLSASDTDDTIIAYSADVTIECAGCGLPFEFIGLPMGLMHTEPTCSVDALEARMPIKPKGSAVRADLTGFKLRRVL